MLNVMNLDHFATELSREIERMAALLFISATTDSCWKGIHKENVAQTKGGVGLPLSV